jgi:hypothetical protein
LLIGDPGGDRISLIVSFFGSDLSVHAIFF